jgi:translocation and assembly module TamB
MAVDRNGCFHFRRLVGDDHEHPHIVNKSKDARDASPLAPLGCRKISASSGLTRAFVFLHRIYSFVAVRRKKFIAAVAAIALALAAWIALTPVWFPWALAPILTKRGVTCSAYSRSGATRLILQDVTYAQGGYHFSARQIELMTPTAYLWRRWFGSKRADALIVNDWRLDIGFRAAAPGGRPHQELKKTQSIAESLEYWIPKAVLKQGTIAARSVVIDAPSVQWEDGSLSAALEWPRYGQTAAARVDFPRKRPPRFKIDIAPSNRAFNSVPLTIQGELSPSTNIASIQGTVNCAGNNARFSVDFDPADALPAMAALEAPAISLPAAMFGIPGYTTLDGALTARWRAGKFDIDARASARPMDTNNAPPLTVSIRGGGDTNSLRIEALDITTPWLNARLSDKLAFDFTGRMLTDSAELSLTADMDRQPWLPVRGQFAGRAFLRRGANAFPDIAADLSGQGIQVRDITASTLNLSANLAWPVAELTRFEARFANGAIASGTAAADLKARSILRAELAFSGSLPMSLPAAGFSPGPMVAAIQARGPWNDLAHSGQLTINSLTAPGLSPMRARLEWDGTRLSLSHIDAQLTAGNSRLSLSGSAELGRRSGNAVLTALDFDTDGGQLALDNAVTVKFQLDDSTNKTGAFLAQIDKLRLRGTEGEITLDGSVNWPESGDLRFSMFEINAGIARDFLKTPPPRITISRLDGAAAWNRGPMEFTISLDSDYTPRELTAAGAAELPAALARAAEEPWALSFQGRGGADGITVDKCAVFARTAALVSASGRVPIIIDPRRGWDFLQIQYSEPLKAEITARPDSSFIEWLTAGSRFKIEGARMSANVTGTIEHPRGEATFDVDRLFMAGSSNQPPLNAGDIAARFNFAEREIALTGLTARVEGQAVTARGALPIPERLRDWRALFDWRGAAIEFSAPQISLASAAAFLPDYLSPQGSAQVELAVAPGGLLTGRVSVKGAASRPLPNVGPLQEIDADVRLTGHKLVIEHCRGLVGGEPVVVFGEIGLPEPFDLTRARSEPRRIFGLTEPLPAFDLTVRGESVPLVRRADFILRARFDLKMSNTGSGPPTVSGKAVFQDSFFLSDLKPLVPESVDKPQKRPPYFSVELEPFARWKLDVALRGDKFLKIRSPFFTGTASADFRVTGTLKEPLALGVAKIDDGAILFPFASLKVTQGEVTLTAASPYLPRLFVNASSRVYTYDVRAQISGLADRPDIEFSSTPGLAPEQILLMLTSGEMPLNETASSAQQRAGHVAMFVGKNILSRLGLGTGAEDRLTLSSGPSEIQPGTQTYGFEYKLSDDWWVTGDYDQFGGLNLGLRWRFYSK